MSSKSWLLFFCAMSASAVLFAQTTTPPQGAASSPTQVGTDAELVEVPLPADAVDLGTIVFAGRQPGPGLWKVRKGDHVLWILGTQNPLPKRMEWDSAYVQRRIAESQQVLLSPSVSFNSDMGFLRSP
jgi:TraB/PrgY/gumN family